MVSSGSVLFAVLLAVFLMRYLDARKANKLYCLKEAYRQQLFSSLYRLAGRSPESIKINDEEAAQWKKEAKSWVPIHPTDGELWAELEESQDDAIRRMKKQVADAEFAALMERTKV